MFIEVTLSLLQGFGKTLLIFALTLAFSVPLGLLVCFGSMSKLGFTVGGKKICPVSIITKAFVWIIRGTPLMLQLIVIYYGPGLLFHTDLMPRFTAVLVAFVVNYAAYFSEIYRGGIESVPGGQYEACAVLGMTKAQTFFRVILMQVVKRIIPPMSNEIITLVKDTSLSRIIALQEVIWAGQAFMKGSHGIAGAIWPLFFTGVYYLIFSGILTLVLGRVEKKLDYFKA